MNKGRERAAHLCRVLRENVFLTECGFRSRGGLNVLHERLSAHCVTLLYTIVGVVVMNRGRVQFD